MALEVRSDFKSLYCKMFGCNPADYTLDIILRCFKLKVGILALIIYRINPSIFARDIELVEKVGRATEMQHVNNAISNYFADSRFKRNSLHDKFFIRLSCNTLLNIAFKIFVVDESQK